ncbi:MAG TPA: folate-binding protein [Terriglobales bacterium]
MSTTELTEKRMASRRERYHGAETVAVYSDTAQEFQALLSGVGVYGLAWRAKLLVTGRDRVRWLNGMITNNVRDLPVGHGVYSFVLTPQGRILGDLYTYNRGDFLVLDTDQSQVENLVALLRRYIIMDKVEIADAADKLSALGVAGPSSRELLGRLGISLQEMTPLQVVDTTWGGIQTSIVRGDLPESESYEVWLDPANVSRLWQELINAGAHPVGSNALELLRIANGVPCYGQDIRERDLPQETEQSRALNYIKGCYIGQEIVERIRSRGAVHRKFTGFRIEGPLPPAGSKAQVEGKDIAEITSTASLPVGNGNLGVALGYVRREALDPATQIDIGDTKAIVADLPFKDVFASLGGAAK